MNTITRRTRATLTSLAAVAATGITSVLPSGWKAEITALTRAGYPVLAPANPLRGLASDAADRAIPSDAQRFMAHRAGSTVVEVHSSHADLISHPGATIALITKAARTIG